LIKGTSWKDKLYEPERALTRGEAAVLIGRFGRVKWLERWLYNMSIGFDYPSRINTAPVISSLVLEPNTISLSSSKKTAILKAEVSEAQGYEDIINVKANISDFSGPPDAEMYSPKKENGIYLLQFEGSAESTGEKSIKVTATDKYGWKNEKEIKVLVVK